MFDWLQQTIGQRSSHPMNSPAEAARLLSELPLDEPLKAVEEVAAWLESLASATSFATESRLKVISMVDEAGQPCAELLMAEYLEGEARRVAGRFRQWQVLMDFWEKLSEAYQLIALQIEVSKRGELTEQSALVTVRGMRAVTAQMRLALMRHAGETERLWKALYHLYASSHAQRRAAVPVRPYPWDTLSTTARLELVRAVMLEAAAPQSLPPRQIELTARIAARVSSSYAYSEAPGKQLTTYVDLAQTRAPASVPADIEAMESMRFFGPGTAAARLKELLELDAEKPAVAQFFGEEFTVEEKREALQRLQRYWGTNPPRRKHARSLFASRIDVVSGLEAIKQLVRKMDQGVTREGTASTGASASFDVETESAAQPAPDPWQLQDMSLQGFGAQTTRLTQEAIPIGTLIAYRLADAEEWGVGIVRRLTTDNQKRGRIGVEILSMHPRLLLLRIAGRMDGAAWNMEVREDFFSRHLLDFVLLPRQSGTADEDTLLLEPDNYYRDQLFELPLKSGTRSLQMGAVIERSPTYCRAAFKWLDGGVVNDGAAS